MLLFFTNWGKSMEQQIKISEASKISGVPESTIRDMITDGRLNKYEDDKFVKVDKVELLLSLPTIISCNLQKGGNSKTTTVMLLADYFEKMNLKICLIDFDQQANLSQVYFSYEDITENPTIYDYFENHTGLPKIVKKYNDNIDVIVSDIRLARKDFIDTSNLIKYKDEFNLFLKKYQIVLIDNPPALNSFNRFSLLLANYVLIPLIEEKFCYLGLTDAIDTINIMRRLNPDFIDYLGFSSRHKGSRTVLHDNMYNLFKDQLKENFIENVIPESIIIAERSTKKNNIFDEYPNHNVTEKIKNLFDNLFLKMFVERG